MQVFHLPQHLSGIIGDVHIPHDVEFGAIAAECFGGQLKIIIHHSRSLRQNDEFRVFRKERGQRLSKLLQQDGFGGRKSGALGSQGGHVQFGVYRHELLFGPVEPCLCPEQEAAIQLDRAFQHHRLIRVDRQFSVDGAFLGHKARQSSRAEDFPVDDDLPVSPQGVPRVGRNVRLSVDDQDAFSLRLVGSGQLCLAIDHIHLGIVVIALDASRIQLHRILCQQRFRPGAGHGQRGMNLNMLVACQRFLRNMAQVDHNGFHIQFLHRSFLQQFLFEQMAYFPQSGADGSGREFKFLAQLAGVVSLFVPQGKQHLVQRVEYSQQ